MKKEEKEAERPEEAKVQERKRKKRPAEVWEEGVSASEVGETSGKRRKRSADAADAEEPVVKDPDAEKKALRSRKSAAYHCPFSAAKKEGYSVDECKQKGKAVACLKRASLHVSLPRHMRLHPEPDCRLTWI